MKQAKSSLLISWVLQALYIILFISLVFSFRAINSIAIGLLLPATLLYNKCNHNRFLQPPASGYLVYTFTALFLWCATSFLFHPPGTDGWRQLLIKTTLIAMPFAICYSSFLSAKTLRTLVPAYILIVLAGSLYCLGVTIVRYVSDAESSHFFYHNLVSPLKQHAIYFSLLVFFALICLLEFDDSDNIFFRKRVKISIAVFLILFLVLLSSRLIIVYFTLYILYALFARKSITRYGRKMKSIAAILVAGTALLVIFTSNPVSRRFYDLFKGQSALVVKETYQQGDYFNGLQFRLMQWQLVPEILNSRKSWIKGVGADSSQQILAAKYIQKNMYAGVQGTSHHGYLLYNTHNAFLEALLKYGIPGMLLFVLVCLAMVKLALQQRKRAVFFTVVLLLLYSFTEAVLETQFGILIFTFFPLFFARK